MWWRNIFQACLVLAYCEVLLGSLSLFLQIDEVKIIEWLHAPNYNFTNLYLAVPPRKNRRSEVVETPAESTERLEDCPWYWGEINKWVNGWFSLQRDPGDEFWAGCPGNEENSLAISLLCDLSNIFFFTYVFFYFGNKLFRDFKDFMSLYFVELGEFNGYLSPVLTTLLWKAERHIFKSSVNQNNKYDTLPWATSFATSNLLRTRKFVKHPLSMDTIALRRKAKLCGVDYHQGRWEGRNLDVTSTTTSAQAQHDGISRTLSFPARWANYVWGENSCESFLSYNEVSTLC